MTEQEFRNTYPPEIIELMLKRQEEQDNPRDIVPFLKSIDRCKNNGGFDWNKTIERHTFWERVLIRLKFDVFYEKYPKKKNSKILL